MQEMRPLREEVVEKAIASSAARRILAACIRRPLPVKEVSARVGIPLATAYRQVTALLQDGLLLVERSAMTPDGKPYDLYRSRIRLGRIEIAPDRVQVVWELNGGIGDRLADMWKHLGE